MVKGSRKITNPTPGTTITIPPLFSSFSLSRAVPAIYFAVIVGAFVLGIVWERVNGPGGAQVVNNAPVGGDAVPQGPEAGKLTAEQAKSVPAVSNSDYVRGTKNAKVTIVEYSDFQCPFCAQFHPTALQAMSAYEGQIGWVYRHFPLDSIHPQARGAAIASECVGQVGGADAFWKYADYLFENQQTALNDLPGSAAKIGINSSQVKSCIDSGSLASEVDNDYQGGVTAGVTGTPGTFIVNDKGDVWLLPGAVPFESLKQTIDEALK